MNADKRGRERFRRTPFSLSNERPGAVGILALSVEISVHLRSSAVATGCFQAQIEPQRRRWTESNDSAAGVIPGILDAWPRERGRTAASFSLTSRESPGMAS